jgi:hypothetical protein
MKAPLFVVGLVAAALVILAVAVHALADETLFVSPPEMTASQLLHAMSLGRIGPARNMLSRDAQRTTSDQEMYRIADEFRARVGRVHSARAEALRRRGDTLLVRMSVDGERGDRELLLRMVREEGVWSATQLEDVLPAGGALTRERA